MVLYYPYATNSLLPIVMENQAAINTTGENIFYDINRVRKASALFDWAAGTKYGYLLTEDYVFDKLHDTVADLTSTAIVKSAAITVRSVNDYGWCCSVAVQFVECDPIASLKQATQVVFAEGNGSTDKLICCFSEVLELPFTPDGRDWFLRPSLSQSGTGTGSGGWFAS